MRLFVGFLMLSMIVLAMPNEASAHAHLKQASPKVGSIVSPAPSQVELTFTEKLEPKFSSIEVRNAKGTPVQVGKAQAGADRTQLRVPLKPLSPGTYTVNWRALSVDTHRTQGSFTFTVGR